MGSSRVLYGVVLAVAFSVSLAEAETIFSTQGDFIHDDDMQFFTFSVSRMSDVHIYTLSYAGSSAAPGGTNAAGQVIVPDGFAPVLSLFSGSTGQLLTYSAPAAVPGTNTCAYCAVDRDTGALWDADIQIKLAPGTYTLVLTEDDNLPMGGYLSDGFMQQGNGDFTGPYFNQGQPGSFWDAHPDPRTSHWAVDALMAPEPGAFWLCGIGMLAALLLRRVPARAGVRPGSRRSTAL